MRGQPVYRFTGLQLVGECYCRERFSERDVQLFRFLGVALVLNLLVGREASTLLLY